MAEGTSAATEAAQEPQGTPQEPQGTEVDWEAKYNEAVKQGRKWEDRAKANKEKADKWDAYEAEGLSEAEKLAKRAEKAEAELKALRAEAKRQEDAAAVAKETGVPLTLLLHCADRADMEAFAKEYEGETHVPAAPSAPASRIVHEGGPKRTTSEKFGQQVDELLGYAN